MPGNLDDAQEAMCGSRGSMKSVLELMDVPEIEGDTADLDHMRTSHFAP